MRKIFAFMMMTLDGYYEGPNQEFDFWVTDEEFNDFSVEQLDEVDTLLFGRATYEGMASYWPTSARTTWPTSSQRSSGSPARTSRSSAAPI